MNVCNGTPPIAKSGTSTSYDHLLGALKHCSRTRDLESGKQLHARAVDSGVITSIAVANSLIDMYAKCSSMVAAAKVFESLPHPSLVSWNCLIRGYVENGMSELGLELFDKMVQQGELFPDSTTFLAAVAACGSLAAEQGSDINAAGECSNWLEKGKAFHSWAVFEGCCNIFVETGLINMYTKCGSMLHAKGVFLDMEQRNAVTWNSLIRGYVDNGKSKLALQVFESMQEQDAIVEDALTYLAALMACANLAAESGEDTWLEHGKAIHSRAVFMGCFSNIFVASALVDMYAKCGSMHHARSVFDRMIQHNSVSWNSLIQGYVDCGEGEAALEVFDEAVDQGFAETHVTFLAAIDACCALAAAEEEEEDGLRWIEKGKAVHSQAVMSCCVNLTVENSLINMYAKCRSMVHARAVFDNISQPDVVSWSVLCWGYVENGENVVVLELLDHMEDCCSSVSIAAALKACIALKQDEDQEATSIWLEKGKIIHSRAVMQSCCDTLVQGVLVDMYAKCSSITNAQNVFNEMAQRNVTPWNSLLHGYLHTGENEVVLKLLDLMQDEVAPNGSTYGFALTACGALADKEGDVPSRHWLEKAKSIHSQIVLDCHHDNVIMSTMLVDIYARCRNMIHAQGVFGSMVQHNSVTWNCLIRGYVDQKHPETALKAFEAMQEASDCAPDAVTYVAALSGCASLAADEKWLWMGKAIHSQAVMNDCYGISTANTLVKMYAKNNSIVHACCVFDNMPEHDLYTWNALIRGYVDHGENKLALQLVARMDASGAGFDHITFITSLQACTKLGALETGKLFHAEILNCGLEQHQTVGNSLVDFYGKCGCMDEAKKAFDSISVKNSVSWNSLLCGYSIQGNTELVFEAFDKMKKSGTPADEITFVHILSACSHAGLAQEGKNWFDWMASRYGVKPTAFHYTCLVDVLARANCLDEAMELVRGMPFEVEAGAAWKSILRAARECNNRKVAQAAFQHLMGLDCKDAAVYNLMVPIC